jgi:hypothetical protein
MTTQLDLRALSSRVAPEVPHLPHLRESAIATWRGRMVNEHGSARVFLALAAQLEKAGFSREEVTQCAELAEEERTHGILCGAVVEALGGEAVAEALPSSPVPTHDDVSPLEGVLRNLLSISCMSETVAVSLIGAERVTMPAGALRDLLTRIWADEVGHARFGWRIVLREVPRLDDAARRRLEIYLRVAFGHLEKHELAHLPLHACPPPEGAALGLCSGAEARELFQATIDEVIVPQLEAVGLRARRAYETRVAP